MNGQKYTQVSPGSVWFWVVVLYGVTEMGL